jgi:glycosyltransferase A (GT-A) superfamily protein (DUF2064 family)
MRQGRSTTEADSQLILRLLQPRLDLNKSNAPLFLDSKRCLRLIRIMSPSLPNLTANFRYLVEYWLVLGQVVNGGWEVEALRLLPKQITMSIRPKAQLKVRARVGRS